MKSQLRSSLLFPVWIALAAAIGCAYWGFKFEDLADVKEVRFKTVEQQLSAVDCTQIKPDILLSIARQSFEGPRDNAKLFWNLSQFFFVLSVLNLSFVWKHLRSKPVQEGFM